MASPLLPFVTCRLLEVPMHKTKCDIAALFEPEDSKKILCISLAEAVLPSASPSQIATVTFATSSHALDKLLKDGSIIDEEGLGHRLGLGDDFFGLTPLYNPVELEESADLIAITGLGGRAFVSWQNIKGEMWLRDYLPADIPNLRVFTYGFPSALWNSTSTATLANHADHFINQLRNCSGIGRTRPLILMGHSIGCMIIKDALIKLSTSTSTEDVKLFKSIYAMYFFGAPNRGLNNDALLEIYGSQIPGQILRDLGAGSAVLNTMSESWINVSKTVKIATCFELCVTPTSRLAADDPTSAPMRNGPPVMMVSRDSACLYTENEVRIPINLNHSMIVKLTDGPGSEYHTIARTMRKHVQEALGFRHKEWSVKLHDLKRDVTEIDRALSALGDMESQCIDYAPNRNQKPLDTLVTQGKESAARIRRLFDECSVQEFENTLKFDQQALAQKLTEMDEIQIQVSSLCDLIDRRLRVMSIKMLLKNQGAMTEILRQGASLISSNQEVRSDLLRITEQLPVLPTQHCQLELPGTALSQSQGPQPLIIRNGAKSIPNTMSVIQPSSGIVSPVLTKNLETMPPTLPRKDVESRRAFESLFYNDRYSDVTVYLGESKTPFPAHRLVLSISSPYFDDALQSKFKEGIAHEFEFQEDSPHALWRVLQYMYTGDYSDTPSESLGPQVDDLELLRHQRVYALADMFRMEDLKSLSCEKFDKQLKQHWISDTFTDCIREVYSTSRESDSIATRKAVVNAVFLHRELVRKRPFQELIREVGDFAVDLVLVMAGDPVF